VKLVRWLRDHRDDEDFLNEVANPPEDLLEVIFWKATVTLYVEGAGCHMVIWIFVCYSQLEKSL
jgi:hypothetical protein